MSEHRSGRICCDADQGFLLIIGIIYEEGEPELLTNSGVVLSACLQLK